MLPLDHCYLQGLDWAGARWSPVVWETYGNQPTKLLPNNFFTNMFAKVCSNMC